MYGNAQKKLADRQALGTVDDGEVKDLHFAGTSGTITRAGRISKAAPKFGSEEEKPAKKKWGRKKAEPQLYDPEAKASGVFFAGDFGEEF